MILGVDIGGTFTDVIALDPASGRLRSGKTPTRPGRLVDGITAAIDALEIDLSTVGRIVHGSTTATNALIEQTHARTGFIGTRGFTDELDVQRMVRRWSSTEWSAVYDLQQRKPEPFVPRHLRREVRERIAYPGVVVEPLEADELRARALELREEAAEALAVCFLWSPVNDVHERQALAVLRDLLPDVPISISTDVAPIVGEYERMVTTAVNASLMPVLASYLANVEHELETLGFGGRFFVMQSNGGVAEPAAVAARPVATLRGGPVGGAVAARWLAESLGLRNVLACDIGGTSMDATLVVDARVPLTDELEVGYYPVRIPSADVRAIGAGGGSIASFDGGGTLCVGPKSAGSIPGPASYGRGGIAPTLTDANLVLGRLGAETLASAGVALDLERARAALEPIADALNRDVMAAAHAVVTVAVANMADAIRLQTVDRGHDPRQLAMIAFGGAGPLHATLVAEASSMSHVVIPCEPGVFSSLGMTLADQSVSKQHAYLAPLDDVEEAELERRYAALEREASAVLGGADDVRIARAAGMRYVLQEWETRVDVPPGCGVAALRARFHDAHRARYGFARDDKPVELVTLYVDAVRPGPAPEYGAVGARDGGLEGALVATRPVAVDPGGDRAEVPVYDRPRLVAGDRLAGPFIVEEATSTTYAQPGWNATVDAHGNLVVRT